MSVPTLPPAVNRRLSRSNSASSSVSTVKHLGTKIGHRKSTSQARPISSDSINQHFTTLDAATEQHQRQNGIQDRGRSPNLNINRWSHSTTSSMGAVDGDFLRQVSGNAAPVRIAQREPPPKLPAIPKSQYSKNSSGFTLSGPPQLRSPGQRAMSSQRGSPVATREPHTPQYLSGRGSNFTTTPDLETTLSRSGVNDYFSGMMLDHSRGANKYGQQVEGIALQFTSAPSRQKRSDNHKLGHGLYQTTNSSHISLQKKPSHNRQRRDGSTNGSNDTAASGSMSSTKSESSRKGGHRSPQQKNMLSQALAKANQAVLFDNAQNVQGAIDAYVEACNILEQVLMRSTDEADRFKLSNIHGTYSTRIAELYDLDNSFDHLNIDKDLPEAPITTRYLDGQERISFDDQDEFHPSIHVNEPRSMQLPMRQESLLPQIFGGREYIEEQLPQQRQVPPPGTLSVPMDAKYMPPPLSPRRMPTPTYTDDQTTPVATSRPADVLPQGRNRMSSESISWLDTFDEGQSSRSSSRASSVHYRQRDHELVSAIAAELDSAIDAAYDEDLEPEATPRPSDSDMPMVLPTLQQDIDRQAKSGDVETALQQLPRASVMSDRRFDYLTREYLDEEAEEEEELLEMIMKDGYMLDSNGERPDAMTSLPRQSDSSTFSARSSGRTWESSMTAATQGTTLSTLAESPEAPQRESSVAFKGFDEDTLPLHDVDVLARKQSSPLPPLPAADKLTAVGLRDRRLSGQSSRQLKIETFARRASISQQGQPGQGPLLETPSAGVLGQQEPSPELNRSASNTNMSIATLPITPLASVHSNDSMTDSPITPGLTQLLSNSTAGDERPGSAQTDIQRMPPPAMRKNTSSSNLRPTNLSLATNGLNDMPATPGSAIFPTHSRGISVSTPAIPNASSNILTSTEVGGMYLFDHIFDPSQPMSPRSGDGGRSEPLPLEPCPESFLLRPFWLMRCLYQTLAHPRGGYISTKLFVPRDIWRVRGIKLKAIDDKTGQCDVLTAALLKLAKVDTLDADAVLEELQSFDTILDTVRVSLSKKLGSDVGLTGSVVAMNKSPGGEDLLESSKSTSASVKSFASSWRKLRSKSSTPALTPTFPRKNSGAEDNLMASLPMTSSSSVSTSRSYRATRQHPPPTPTGMPHIPAQNAAYMSSLARLFDAVQVLDSIARQVEDPGLKATSKTLVGLELSIRGAAEFFSFYVVRFALADMATLLDKYLKRGGEWVMV